MKEFLCKFRLIDSPLLKYICSTAMMNPIVTDLLCLVSGLVKAFLSVSKHTEALTTAREAAKLMPGSARALTLTGVAYSHLDQGQRVGRLPLFRCFLFPFPMVPCTTDFRK
jgi:hypothetical protein